jgi:ABC-type transport system involved in cytochrome bd biosynthesis fused ATPase/permease subunit
MAFDSYIFDKRKVKKAMTKFIIACAVSFPILLVLNILTSEFDFWLSVLLDSLILLAIFFVVNGICDKHYAKVEARRARRRGEYIAMEERKAEILKESKRKQEIMQNNYKRIRAEKKQAKEQKQKEEQAKAETEVEVVVPDTKEEK